MPHTMKGFLSTFHEITTAVGRALLGWTTPWRRLGLLLNDSTTVVNLDSWESFRDGLTRRWDTLNIVCGLIMSAVSTILFSEMTLSNAAFTLGVMSLLCSLMATGFGVGLTYVLGDVPGGSLKAVGKRWPKLFALSLAIPQLWGGISFLTFFMHACIIGWQATDKGPVVKMGIVATAAILIAHIMGFIVLFQLRNKAWAEEERTMLPRATQDAAPFQQYRRESPFDSKGNDAKDILEEKRPSIGRIGSSKTLIEE